jgi:hypothetical protein
MRPLILEGQRQTTKTKAEFFTCSATDFLPAAAQVPHEGGDHVTMKVLGRSREVHLRRPAALIAGAERGRRNFRYRTHGLVPLIQLLRRREI